MNKTNPSQDIPGLSVKLSADENLNILLNQVVSEVKTYADQLMSQLMRLSEIGRALSGERDLNVLLGLIIREARKFADADAGTLYIMEDNKLHFKIVQNKSLDIYMGGKDEQDITFPPVELVESNVSAFVALHGIPVNIPDVYDTNLFDFTGPKMFDKSTGYRSKSMLVIPMKNYEDDIIGVLQLLNAQNPKTGEVIPFSPDCENMIESLASQAAVAISNVKLINDIEKLFESFVEVMATAIDKKSAVTGGHIRRVRKLTMEMAEAVHNQKEGKFKDITYTPDQFYELSIAAWMHDIGKVTTPVEVIEKGKKLQTIFDRIHHVDLRLKYIIQGIQTKSLKIKLKLLQNGRPDHEIQALEEECKKEIERLEEIRSFILQANEPGEFLEDEKVERLKEIRAMTFADHEGNEINYLTEDELKNLSIRKGSITAEERQIMKNHAAITLDMLNKIPFTKKLRNIPKFAAAHHECIDGSGYPLGLKGDEIPFDGKLMAVTDIAEALTASDRPYKKAMPLENVFRILRSMASNGQLDPDLVELFINEDIYQKFQRKSKPENSAEKPSEISMQKKELTR